MLTDQFIILSDNGVESDISIQLNDYRKGEKVTAIVATEDAIYIGSDLPFTSRYFKVSSPNDLPSFITPYVWWGNTWASVARTIDYTSIAGATLAQSGVIEWILDNLKSWDRELYSQDVDGITVEGLYNLYWLKLVFSDDLDLTTTLQYIGFKFTEDNILFDHYPDLDNASLMEAFESGKTDWDNQHFAAAETIIADLRKKDIIKSPNQILRRQIFEKAAVYKTAELIYQGLGNSFRDDRDDTRKLYNEAMNLQFFDIDTDGNGKLSEKEKNTSMRFFTR